MKHAGLKNCCRNLFFFVDISHITLYEDNQSTIKIAYNPGNRRVKHLDIKHYFIQEKLETGVIKVEYVCTRERTDRQYIHKIFGRRFI